MLKPTRGLIMASVGQVNRMPNADLCRVVAIFGVILIHTAAPVFYNYRVIALQDFLIANGIDSIARVSVPLFAMLSGAILLLYISLSYVEY